MAHFRKMHGLGNDFAVFDARKQKVALDAAAARAIADRRHGVGCDQVIVIEPATNGADAFMRIFNSDGSEVESCGNAARCVARVLMEEKHRETVSIATKGGPLQCAAQDNLVTVNMGVPKFGWRDIPMSRDTDTLSFAIEVAGVRLHALETATAVNIGNPHVVLFVDDAEAAPVAEIGPKIEIHPLFPQRANVEFVSRLGENCLRMRVWERGVGITMACGTGACATMAAAQRRGLVGNKAQIILDGGPLTLEWNGEGSPILMTGPWAETYAGEIDLAAIAP